MKFGIVVFPGSNCDHDAFHVVKNVLGQEAQLLWHKDRDLKGSELVILPGGFSYGDYLRCGAIARFSPVMEEVAAFAKKGGPVSASATASRSSPRRGCCRARCSRTRTASSSARTWSSASRRRGPRFTRATAQGETFSIPIAHGDGNYFIDDEGLKRARGRGPGGLPLPREPQRERADIAGIVNARGTSWG